MKGLHIFDTEADGLLDIITKFHCALFKEYNKDNWHLFLDFNHPEFEVAKKFAENKNVNLSIQDFSDLYGWLQTEPASIACHNLYGFDLPAMKKVLGIDYDMFKDKECRGTIGNKQVNIFDTLSMSRCLYPDRPVPDGCPQKVKCPVTNKLKTIGGHGLEAWGYRVANKKVQIDDWRNQPLWTYVDRVWEDVTINELVWTWLINEATLKGEEDFFVSDIKKASGLHQINWKNALRRNMLADYLMTLQEFQGVVFNKKRAEDLVVKIDEMMKELADEVEPRLPPKLVSKSKQPKFPTKPFDEQGNISSAGWKWLTRLGYKINEDALVKKEPIPAKPFKKDGSVSSSGKSFCLKNGVVDELLMADFIKNYKVEQSSPLPPDQMASAMKDLQDQKPIVLYEPMRLGNQDDLKRFLVSEGWVPTLWRQKDVTRGEFKKQRPQNEIDDKVREYIDDISESEYLPYLLRELGISQYQFKDREFVFKKLQRKARGLPTSPQLKDMRGVLCPNLERLEGDMAKKVVKWLSLRNRRSVIKPFDDDNEESGWLNHPRLMIDGKLPARANGITNTNRRKHSVCCNVPKPKDSVLLGKEVRSLWTVPDDCYLIGVDGSNLEGMIAAAGAYAFDGGDYLRIMESEDAHERNARAYTAAAEREVTRDAGKGVTYGIMYGAQKAKIAVMLGITEDKAQNVIDAFWDSNLGLKGRREWLEQFWEATGKKFIPSFDGRKIWTRSKHSLLNAFQQSSGACLFDLVGILFHHRTLQNGMYEAGVRRVIYYHDEYQIQVPKSFVNLVECSGKEEAQSLTIDGKKMAGKPKQIDGKWYAVHSPVGELMVKCVEQAAKLMLLPVHITGEYLVGLPSEGWSGTH